LAENGPWETNGFGTGLALPMNIRVLLEANHKKLLEQYSSSINGVLSLQATLIGDILPGIEDELDLDAENAKWAREWLNDTCEHQ
jgi:hypothetical protein